MADRLSPAERSALMARVKGKDTRPELVVRRLLHGLGYRFRIHIPTLPGRPDLAFTARRKAVLVHGCFWHAHEGCRGSRVPSTRSAFWESKFRTNRERDRRQEAERDAIGWRSLVVWECEMKDRVALGARLVAFLGPPRIGTDRVACPADAVPHQMRGGPVPDRP